MKDVKKHKRLQKIATFFPESGMEGQWLFETFMNINPFWIGTGHTKSIMFVNIRNGLKTDPNRLERWSIFDSDAMPMYFLY